MAIRLSHRCASTATRSLNKHPCCHMGRSISTKVEWVATRALISNSNLLAHSIKAEMKAPPFQRLFSSMRSSEENEIVGDESYLTVQRRRGIRNVAIVAHVDHGKTTLVDELLKASTLTNSGSSSSSSERQMDSGELEKERGITITSKVTRLDYFSDETLEDYVINVVDTPGHADFAGEVDRILSTVDGVCLLVDAAEGPKSQTKYVLSRALAAGLVPICVLTKADRAIGASKLETGETESDLLDLFDSLGANEEQMSYRTLFTSARSGWCTDDIDLALRISSSSLDAIEDDRRKTVSMKGLLDAIIQDIPEPSVHSYMEHEDENNVHSEPPSAFENDKFSMTATTVGYDQYLGRTITGRIYSGSVGPNDSVAILRRRDDDDEQKNTTAIEKEDPRTLTSTVSGLFVNRGASRTPLANSMRLVAGDIATVAGVPDSIRVGDTLTSSSNPIPHPVDTPPLAPPTLSCLFGANDGPLAGNSATTTSSQVRARLISETDNNVTLTVETCENDAEKTVVYGRGELQLGILVEQMRRENMELVLSPPMVVTKICEETKRTLEPYEEVVVDVDAEYAGAVIDALTGQRRRGQLSEMVDNPSDGKTRLTFIVPTRGLLGFGPEIATTTRGTAIVHHCYLEDRELAGGSIGTAGDIPKLVSSERGKATFYALSSLADRGTLFIEPGDSVYPGMVIGECAKSGGNMDLEVNPVRAKQATNIRTVNKDEKVQLSPAKKMTVEELIGYMSEDEVIEITPESVRLRKAILDAGERQRAARSKKKRINAAAGR